MVIDVVIQIKIQLKLLLQMQFHKIVPFRLISAKSVRTFHNHQIDPIRLNVPNHPLIFQTMLRLRAGLRLYILIHDRKVIVLHQFPRVCHLHIQCLHLYLLLRRHPVVDCHPCLRRKFWKLAHFCFPPFSFAYNNSTMSSYSFSDKLPSSYSNRTIPHCTSVSFRKETSRFFAALLAPDPVAIPSSERGFYQCMPLKRWPTQNARLFPLFSECFYSFIAVHR